MKHQVLMRELRSATTRSWGFPHERLSQEAHAEIFDYSVGSMSQENQNERGNVVII